MGIAFRSLVPMAHVADIERSIAFYAQLGFEAENTFHAPGAPALTWAWLRSEGGAELMLAKADLLLVPEHEGVLFYLYCDDVQGVHAALVAAGVNPGPITYPFYCPKGEFPVTDPDGYALMVTHT